MSDGAFRALVHRNPCNHVDIVDAEWRKEKLENDEIVIPPEHDFSVDESDQHATTETQEQADKKWNDVGMQEFQ